MPLVRVTGVDADAFDVSDVAKMNDHSHSRASWYSRRPNTLKHLLGPSDVNTDETPSTDSSSMVSSGVHSDRDGGAGGRHSFASVNSNVSTTILSTPHIASGGNNNNRSYNISGSANSTNFDNYYDDPRNPFDTQRIPEEDEDYSGSSANNNMEDCSLSGNSSTYRGGPQHHNHQQQQPSTAGYRRTNSLRSQSTMPSSSKQHASSQHQQQRHPNVASTFREEEEDDIMSISSSIQTSSIRHKDISTAINAPSSAYTSQLVSQLESQVAKLNFELATTKSDLDQIQLENRKLHDEKSEWHKEIRLLKDENNDLRLTIEQMERDKLMRTMESTKGVGRIRTSMDVGSCVVWGGSSVSGHTWVDSSKENASTITTLKQELKHVEKLDVSFRDSKGENRHTYKQALRSSFASTGSYLSEDMDKSIGSVGSVNLDNSGGSGGKGQELDEDASDLRLSLQSALDMFRPMQRLQDNIHKRITSVPSRSKNDEESSAQSNHLTNESAADVVNGLNEDKADHNRHKADHNEEEDYDDDDPFATWSENRERSSNKKKWFQRGDGQKLPQSQNIDAEEEEIARAKEEIVEEDPFDTAKGASRESEYISFAEDGNLNDSSHNGEDVGSVTQQPRRGFRLPWQRGNEGR